MAGVSSKSGCRGFLVAASALILSLFFLSSFSSGAYSPTIKFELPVKEPGTGNLGVFARNESINLNLNLTFDYPLPAGENETNMTAEIWNETGIVQSKTIPLKAYMEKYGVTKDGRYVFKPLYFNITADVGGRNVTSTPISLGYSLTQYRRKPYLGEGDKKWKIWGRYISGQGGAPLTNYCSGPWDFDEGATTTGVDGCTGDYSVNIQKGGYTIEGTTKSYQNGPILYFMIGATDKIPSTPGSGTLPLSKWESGHSWKFETFVYPTIDYSGNFKVYADNGTRIIISELDGSRGTGNTSIAGMPQIIPYSFSKEKWYRIEVYVYNNPGGNDASNPVGVRIEDQNSGTASILGLIGGDEAVMSSEEPGANNLPITGSETIYAGGLEGLSEIADFPMFSTDHVNVNTICDNPDVSCSLRMACGNSEYKGLTTNKYGWILNRKIYPDEWDKVGGNPTIREYSITSDGKRTGTKIDFDRTSIENGCQRARYTANWFGTDENTSIGGIYRCKQNWDSWEIECSEGYNRYNYTESSKLYKCCYVEPISITPQTRIPYGGVTVEKDYIVRINYPSSLYSYIINFLPPYGYAHEGRDCRGASGIEDSWFVGDKLCAIPDVTVYEEYPIRTLHQSNYTNRLCSESTLSRCCYCRPGWGCRLDCVNELGKTASERITLPFPMSSGQLWSLRDVSLSLMRSTDAVDLTAEGNATDGWFIRANLSDSASLMLDKNYTIPLNLLADFGLKVPERRGEYRLKLKLDYKGAAAPIQAPDYKLYAVDCTTEGVKRSFYDEAAYPGTKGVGTCMPGLQVCKKVSDVDFRWRYESKYDMPVYPCQTGMGCSNGKETLCNGLDEDCNGIADDINGFDWIISQILASGGRKTPYDITKCGCFMGAAPREEKCNGVDDDCDGTVDNSEARLWINTCDSAIRSCVDEGSPYQLCKRLYNATTPSPCGLAQATVTATGNMTINTCTARVKTCMDNQHVSYTGDTPSFAGGFTYDECKGIYDHYSCMLQEKDIVVLGDPVLGNTCRCTGGSAPTPETCNGIDDNCNKIIDDVGNGTCACAMLTNITRIRQLKAGGDSSCNGIDSNCNGAIDEGAANCACRGMPPEYVLSIKANAKEMCNGIDDNCNGLIDEDFPEVGTSCGYGVCAGGGYVCNALGNGVVCNTTVSPSEAFGGRATKLSSNETCDLRDNDCDGAIDEGCSCTPENALKICGYQSGIYYKNRTQLDQMCDNVLQQLRTLIGGAMTDAEVYQKCTQMLGNVSSSNGTGMATLLSLCDSIRICNKTDFPVNPTSECNFGTQTCTGGKWGACTAVLSRAESCNGKDDDCNGMTDDVAIPSICACYNGTHVPGEVGEECNGIDDDCDGVVDDVRGGNSPNSTHCGCFNQTVNITQRSAEVEMLCNGIDNNCNGVVDEGLDNCVCSGTLFGPYNNTLAQNISAEKCNGVDDDCDGIIDDPWQQGGSSATASQYLGAVCGPLNSRCSGGRYVCSRSGSGIVCSTTSNEGTDGQNMAASEACNGLDDDCNGAIDDVKGNGSGRFCQCYNGVPAGSETCDGKDNNCNGLVDDGLFNCGCSFDMMVNTSNIDQLTTLIDAKKASSEICNNIDDNCNRAIDEGLSSTCFCEGSFSGNPAMRPEFCNGVDDDCNGLVDDVAHPERCACNNRTHAPGEINETCNSVDDNCNGLVDEGWQNLGGSCGIGACVGGIFECSANGRREVCSTEANGSQSKYQAEICGNGLDDDCDGPIDEGCACDAVGVTRNCSDNVGECRIGVQTCMVGGWSNCIGGIWPSPEVCDNKDNSCDGITDNVPNPSACACSNGGTPATEACNGVDDNCDGAVDNVGGKNSVEATKCGCYNNANARGSKMELCNGMDDDCSGVIDDVKGGNSAASAQCACYGGVAPATEKCNGVDDNCNGLIDDTWTNLGQTCGQGICIGVLACSQDGEGVQCSGAQPQSEVCDGKDNNCDGAIDEGCFGGGINSCQNDVKDGDEEGTDCGGSCPNPCVKKPPQLPEGSWILVFVVLIVVIVVVGVVLLFLKPAKPV